MYENFDKMKMNHEKRAHHDTTCLCSCLIFHDDNLYGFN